MGAIAVADVDRRDRVAAGALDCIARWGIAKTTLDDVARAAGCSRATVYRAFPGGKDVLLAHVARTEIERFFVALDERLASADDDLESLVVDGITFTARWVETHPALRTLVAHDPGAVLPHLAFHRLDPVLAFVVERVAPHLAPHVDEPERAAEWLARIVLVHLLRPSSDVELTERSSVTRMVRRFVLPGLRATEGATR